MTKIRFYIILCIFEEKECSTRDFPNNPNIQWYSCHIYLLLKWVICTQSYEGRPCNRIILESHGSHTMFGIYLPKMISFRRSVWFAAIKLRVLTKISAYKNTIRYFNFQSDDMTRSRTRTRSCRVKWRHVWPSDSILPLRYVPRVRFL